MEDSDLISSLQCEVESLKYRVQELLAENEKLSSRLSVCGCNQKEENFDGCVANGEKSAGETWEFGKDSGRKSKKKVRQQVPGDDMRKMSRFRKRYVALKVMYFGQRFYGFASEAQMDPTVESEIFKALEKTRLAVGCRKELQYSRCGRTDKGVSSVGQVISLFLRSNLKENNMNNNNSGEHDLIKEYEGEIDYVGLLNRVLPRDIRIIGWCPAPVDFSARFSCMSREYKYFFWRDNLDLVAMENAGKKFIGEHDFRNFCKMDAQNVHNYKRNISCFEIFPSDVRFDGSQLYAIKIKGTAFLWHQVRCIVAVLFMIGQGLESPQVVDTLLDTEKTIRKPQYVMASEIPLILHSCEFEGLKFTCSLDAGLALHAHLKNECRTYHLQAAIFHEALLNCLPLAIDRSLSHKGKTKVASHVPLMSRPTEPTYDERRVKLSSRT